MRADKKKKRKETQPNIVCLTAFELLYNRTAVYTTN